MSKKKRRKTIFLTTLLVFMVLSTTLLLNWEQIRKKVSGSRSQTMSESQSSVQSTQGSQNASGKDSSIESLEEQEENARIDVSEYAMKYNPEGFAGADPEKQVGTDLSAFEKDLTFFNRELSKYEQALLDAANNDFIFVGGSFYVVSDFLKTCF